MRDGLPIQLRLMDIASVLVHGRLWDKTKAKAAGAVEFGKREKLII